MSFSISGCYEISSHLKHKTEQDRKMVLNLVGKNFKNIRISIRLFKFIP